MYLFLYLIFSGFGHGRDPGAIIRMRLVIHSFVIKARDQEIKENQVARRSRGRVISILLGKRMNRHEIECHPHISSVGRVSRFFIYRENIDLTYSIFKAHFIYIILIDIQLTVQRSLQV